MAEPAKSEDGSDAYFLGTFKTRVDSLLKWEKDNSDFVSQFSIKMNVEKYAKELEHALMKREKASTDLVFIGKTSCGKSMTINSLLGLDVMRVAIGDSLQSTVRIQTTSEPTSYFQYSSGEERHAIDFNDEKGVEDFHDIVERSSDGDSHSNQGIEVFISKSLVQQDCILSDLVTILDTPGMDRDAFGTEGVRKCVLDADTLILVADIVSWSDIEGLRKLFDDPGFPVRPDVIVAVNKCDALLEENSRRREKIKSNIKKELSELAVFEGRTKEEVENSIFFVSAKLASKLRTSDSKGQTTEEEDALADEFRNLEQAVCRAVKKERIDDAIQRCRRNLKAELDRIASEMNTIKECIRQLHAHVAESTSKVKERKDHQFVKTALMEDLLYLDSGVAKVLSFLKYCKVYQVEDIKNTIVRMPVDNRISDFIDRIVSDEIDKIGGIVDEDSIRHLSKKLDPVKFDGSSFDKRFSDIRERIEDAEERFSNLCNDKRSELDATYKELSKAKESEIEDRQRKIAQIKMGNKWHFKKAILGAVATAASTLSFFSVTSGSQGIFGRVEWSNAYIIAVAIFGVALGVHGAYKLRSGKKEIKELKQRSESDNQEIRDESVSKNSKLEDYNSDQEYKKNLTISRLKIELEKCKRSKIEEEQRMKAEYKRNHKTVLTEIYAFAISHIIEALQTKLDATAAHLERLETEGSKTAETTKEHISEEWQWVS